MNLRGTINCFYGHKPSKPLEQVTIIKNYPQEKENKSKTQKRIDSKAETLEFGVI